MTFDTYANLQTEIADYMKRADLTTRIRSFIDLAEADIYRDLRTWRFESSESITVSSGQPTTAMPAGTRDVTSVFLTGNKEKELRRMPLGAMRHQYRNAKASVPAVYAFSEGNIIIEPSPSEDHTLTALCIIMPTALSDSNTSNSILTNYPDLYLYGAAKHGFMALAHEKRMIEAERAYEAGLSKANKESRRFRTGGTNYGIVNMSNKRVP